MGTLGYTGVGSLEQFLKRGTNTSQNHNAFVTPTVNMTITSLSFYGKASQDFYGSHAAIHIGTVIGNTLTHVSCGDYKPVYNGCGLVSSTNRSTHLETFNFTTDPKPVLIAGTTYLIGVSNISTYPWYLNYNTSADTFYTHGYSGYFAVDEINRQYSIYITYTDTGPALKIEGITPGKLEYTSWSLISDVK